MSGVAALYDDAVAWFIRFFTPPDDRVGALSTLAERPYADGLVDDLRKLVVNSHHLCLFFSRLQDPTWLDPLHDAGLIHLPRDGERWPVAFLVGGAGAIDPDRVAGVLERLLRDSKSAGETRRLSIARDILQSASRLGVAGHAVAMKVIRKYPADRWVQMIAVSIAKDADPTDPIQLAVADAVMGYERSSDGGYYTRTMLGRLADGLTPDNVAARFGMMAVKIRRLASSQRMRIIALDIASLHTPGEDLREPVVVLAQQLATLIPIARALGLSTSDLLGMLEKIPGQLGERIICQVLAGADDVERDLKIGHIERRLASDTATGDDRDLVNDILKIPLTPDELNCWRTAFGEPSSPPRPVDRPDAIGDNWARAWRWSIVLPPDVLEEWEEAIAAVTAQHGAATSTSLDTRVPRVIFASGRSPHSSDDLSALPVLDAAALVSAWRPSTTDAWDVSARELARALETVVTEDPRGWTEDPRAVVTALREPVYVDHYFRAVTEKASDLADRASAVIAAVELVRAKRWEPAAMGSDSYEYESDWSSVDTATIDMIAAFANKHGDLAADLDLC